MTIASTNGTTGSTIQGGSDFSVDIERLFRQQQQYWPSIRDSSANERIAKLRQLYALMLRRRKDIAAACYADFRKPSVEVDLTELLPVTLEAKFAMRHVRQWMQPRRIKTPLTLFGTRSEIRYEPKGVALIIGPWNYPFNLTLGPLVGAIAAGCCTIVKPSEFVPHSSRLMREMLAEIFDEREVAVVEGDYTVGQALLQLPFNHIYFTGSPQVGKIVMRAAAEHLASVTLELGGKSPTIVDETVDVADAAQKIAWGKFSNNGQTCIAPDYVLVQERVHDAFVDQLREQIRTFYGTSPTAQAQSPDYARIVNERHQQRMERLYTDAVREGAQVATGGTGDLADNYIAPTVLTDVSPNSSVMQEEIFGPVLPVLKYQSLDEAIRFVNDKPNPLALYMFSKNDDHVEQVLRQTSAGGTCVNETLLHFMHPALPFGGAGYSGIGKGHGHHGFLAFSNERSVLRRTIASPVMRLLYPPYGTLTRRIAQWLPKLS